MLTKIHRQQIPRLREATEDLSKGRTGDGFDKLDKFGAIQEIADSADRLAAIAEKHIEALEAQRSTLIIAPTHGECRAIAGAVRKAMRDKGLLLESEHSVTRFQRLNLTDSQQGDAVTYEPGQIVEFHRMAKGVVRGGVQEKRFKSGEQLGSPERGGRTQCYLAGPSHAARHSVDLLIRPDGETAKRWLSTVIDDYSRAVAGYFISFQDPSALHTSLALRQAIWRKEDARYRRYPMLSSFGAAGFVLDYGLGQPPLTSRDQREATMSTKIPNTLPPMPGSELFIHNVDSAPAYWWLDDLWIVLAEAKDTGGRFSMMEELLRKDSGPGPHKHTWSDETFYMLDGEITFLIGDEIKTARTGDFLMVPRNTRHAFRVTSETARFLNGYTPASLEAALVEFATPAIERVLPPKNASTIIKMTPELLSRYGMDMLPGPDPLRPEGDDPAA